MIPEIDKICEDIKNLERIDVLKVKYFIWGLLQEVKSEKEDT